MWVWWLGCAGTETGTTDTTVVGTDPTLDTSSGDDTASGVDTALECEPPTAPAPWTRNPDNPSLLPGATDAGQTDVLIADPDLQWDGSEWVVYYMAPRGVDFSGPLTQTVRRATSVDGATFALSPIRALEAAADPTAWDHQNTETPSVAYAADAAPDRRFALAYSGAPADGEPLGFASYAIGIAFSADGEAFTRLPAAESPHGEPGLALTFADVYPGSEAGVVADPELVYHDGVWHLWFSSFGCSAGCTVVDAYGVSHATSTDAVHWDVDAAPIADLLRTPGAPTTGGGQPSAVWDDLHCQWELWFTSDLEGATNAQPVRFNNASGFRRATSPDAVHWTVDFEPADLSWDPAAPGEPLGLLTGADVAAGPDGGRRMAYVGFTDQDIPPGLYLPVSTDFDPAGFAAATTALNVAAR